MTKLAPYGTIKKDELDLDNSVEIDEEDPIIEVVSLKPKKDFRKWFSIGFVSVIVIVSCICMTMYFMDNEPEENHQYLKQHIREDNEETYLSAHFAAWRSHKKRRHKKCSDYEFGCCKIVYGCGNQTDTTTISPQKIVKRDKQGSNCPTLDYLKKEYNKEYEQDCQINGCKVDKIGCPSVHTLVELYDMGWPNMETDMEVLLIISVIIIFIVIMCYCCEKCK